MDSTHAAIEGVGQTHRQLVESFIQTEFANFDAQCPHLPCKDTMRNITVGIVVKPADLYVEKGDGVLALRSLNLFPNRFLLDDVVEISHAGHAAHSKSALDAGDVVVVRTGRPGDAAVVPEELSGINCIDLIVAKPSAALDPFYVVTFLNSQFGRRIFSSGTTGTAQQHFNVGEFSKLKIPIPPKQIQHAFVDKLRSFEKVGSEVSARVAALRDTRSLFLNSTVFGAE